VGVAENDGVGGHRVGKVGYKHGLNMEQLLHCSHALTCSFNVVKD